MTYRLGQQNWMVAWIGLEKYCLRCCGFQTPLASFLVTPAAYDLVMPFTPLLLGKFFLNTSFLRALIRC